MNRILHLDCSPRPEGSESARLSRAIVDRLVRQHLARGSSAGPAAGHDRPCGWRLCPRAGHPGAAADLARGSLADSEILIRELESADCLVIGTPMHNYTVPSALKAWIDHGCARTGPSRTSPPASWACWRTARYMSRCRPADPSRPSRAPARLPHAVPDRHPEHHRSAHDPFLFGPARGGGDALAGARSQADAELERHFAAVHA